MVIKIDPIATAITSRSGKIAPNIIAGKSLVL